MKIAHIITGLPSGGAEGMLCKLLAYSDRSRFESVVISLQGQGVLGQRIRELEIPLYCMNMWGWGQPIHAWFRLANLLKRIGPDLVQGWMYYGNLAALLARYMGPVSMPVAWNVRQSLYDLSAERRQTALMIRVGAHVSKQPAAIVYNSHVGAEQHELRGYCRGNRRILPNGFDCDEFAHRPEARPWLRHELGFGSKTILIGLVARFHPMKDHKNFLEAAGKVARCHSNVGFVLVGEGIEEHNNDLMSVVESVGIRKRVRALGQRADVSRIMAGLDIVASASWTEGFPNVVGEAMACEVPCVVTDVGESSHIVGETGVVVPPRDSHALAQACEKLIDVGKEGRRSLGRAARSRIVARFSITHVAYAYERLYETIVAGTANPDTHRVHAASSLSSG